jgi:hypothetical protein
MRDYLMNLIDPAVHVEYGGQRLRAKVPFIWRLLLGRGRE